MASRRTVNAGVQVDGLTETFKALGNIDRELEKAAKKAIRDNLKPVVKDARSKIRRQPSYPSGTPASIVGYSVTRQGASLVLKASNDPRALAMEFGANYRAVGWESDEMEFGHQSAFRRRANKPHTGLDADVLNGSAGYVIQPTIRRHLKKFLEETEDDLADMMSRELDRAGVPRG